MQVAKGEPTTNYFRVDHHVPESVQFRELPLSAKVLYFTLCKLRNRYGQKDGSFRRSDRQLSEDSALNKNTIKPARQQLKAIGLIKTWQTKNNKTRYKLSYWLGHWRPTDWDTNPKKCPTDWDAIH